MEQNFKDTFSELIESLKRSQRAELVDEKNNSVLEELYVDPFDGNMVIWIMSKRKYNFRGS